MTDHTRETTPLYIKTTNGMYLPVVSTTCVLCDETVDPLAPESQWTIARVSGDSANGYELMHTHEERFDWIAWERDNLLAATDDFDIADNLHPADECLNGCHDVDYGADETVPTVCNCSPWSITAAVERLRARGIRVVTL